jgi:nucleotidyltransferase substrate binding protein (TIGR01987 family)
VSPGLLYKMKHLPGKSNSMEKKSSDSTSEKLRQAVGDLKHALEFEGKASKDSFYYLGIAKAFEVCLEYAWKFLKKQVEDEGLEARSPKEAIKIAGRLDIIDDVEKWLSFINTRNLAVHDYKSISDKEYLETIHSFSGEVSKLIS